MGINFSFDPAKLRGQFLDRMQSGARIFKQEDNTTPLYCNDKSAAIDRALRDIGWGAKLVSWVAACFGYESLRDRVSNAWDQAKGDFDKEAALKFEALHTALQGMDVKVPRETLIRNLQKWPDLADANFTPGDYAKIRLLPETELEEIRNWNPTKPLPAPPAQPKEVSEQIAELQARGLPDREIAEFGFRALPEKEKGAVVLPRLKEGQAALERKIPDAWREKTVLDLKTAEGEKVLQNFSDAAARIFLSDAEEKIPVAELRGKCQELHDKCVRLKTEQGRLEKEIPLDLQEEGALASKIRQGNPVFKNFNEENARIFLSGTDRELPLDKLKPRFEVVYQQYVTWQKAQTALEETTPPGWGGSPLDLKIEEGFNVIDQFSQNSPTANEAARAFLPDLGEGVPDDQLKQRCEELYANCLKLKDVRIIVQILSSAKGDFSAVSKQALPRVCALLEISSEVTLKELKTAPSAQICLQKVLDTEPARQGAVPSIDSVVKRLKDFGFSEKKVKDLVLARCGERERAKVMHRVYVPKVREKFQKAVDEIPPFTTARSSFNNAKAEALYEELSFGDVEAAKQEAQAFLGEPIEDVEELKTRLGAFCAVFAYEAAIQDLKSGDFDKIAVILNHVDYAGRFLFEHLQQEALEEISFEDIPNCAFYLNALFPEEVLENLRIEQALWIDKNPPTFEASSGKKAQHFIDELKEKKVTDTQIKQGLLKKLTPEERQRLQEIRDPVSQEVTKAKELFFQRLNVTEQTLDQQIAQYGQAPLTPAKQQKLDLLKAAKSLTNLQASRDEKKVAEARKLILKAYDVPEDDVPANIAKIREALASSSGAGVEPSHLEELKLKLQDLETAQSLVVYPEPRMDQLRLFLGPDQFLKKLEEAFPPGTYDGPLRNLPPGSRISGGG